MLTFAVAKRMIWTTEEAKQHHYSSDNLAKALPALLDKSLPVLDFGCGRGDYLKFLAKKGFECIGIEGTPDASQFKNTHVADLSKPVTIDLPKGNVLSFEVGEHIEKEGESNFLDTLARFAEKRIVMSWAIPGQGGIGHVNERSNVYIVRRMQERNFVYNRRLSNEIRQKMNGDALWWFQNTLLVFDRF